ncbi:MAG: hypothetical protein V3573_04790 [Desulfovibrionaceae bacterium]
MHATLLKKASAMALVTISRAAQAREEKGNVRRHAGPDAAICATKEPLPTITSQINPCTVPLPELCIRDRPDRSGQDLRPPAAITRMAAGE